MPNIKNRDKLLAELAYQLEKKTSKPNMGRGDWNPRVLNIAVTFKQDKEEIAQILGLPLALSYLVNDIYTDNENGDWSEADGLEIDTY